MQSRRILSECSINVVASWRHYGGPHDGADDVAHFLAGRNGDDNVERDQIFETETETVLSASRLEHVRMQAAAE